VIGPDGPSIRVDVGAEAVGSSAVDRVSSSGHPVVAAAAQSAKVAHTVGELALAGVDVGSHSNNPVVLPVGTSGSAADAATARGDAVGTVNDLDSLAILLLRETSSAPGETVVVLTSNSNVGTVDVRAEGSRRVGVGGRNTTQHPVGAQTREGSEDLGGLDEAALAGVHVLVDVASRAVHTPSVGRSLSAAGRETNVLSASTSLTAESLAVLAAESAPVQTVLEAVAVTIRRCHVHAEGLAGGVVVGVGTSVNPVRADSRLSAEDLGSRLEAALLHVHVHIHGRSVGLPSSNLGGSAADINVASGSSQRRETASAVVLSSLAGIARADENLERGLSINIATSHGADDRVDIVDLKVSVAARTGLDANNASAAVHTDKTNVGTTNLSIPRIDTVGSLVLSPVLQGGDLLANQTTLVLVHIVEPTSIDRHSHRGSSSLVGPNTLASASVSIAPVLRVTANEDLTEGMATKVVDVAVVRARLVNNSRLSGLVGLVSLLSDQSPSSSSIVVQAISEVNVTTSILEVIATRGSLVVHAVAESSLTSVAGGESGRGGGKRRSLVLHDSGSCHNGGSSSLGGGGGRRRRRRLGGG